MRPEPSQFIIITDPDAPPGDVLPPLAALLRRLARRPGAPAPGPDYHHPPEDTTMSGRLTAEVALELNVPPNTLASLVRSRRMPPPAKDLSGRYCWQPTDVEAARRPLSTDRRRKEHRRPRQEPAA
jgi:hypothetical protein